MTTAERQAHFAHLAELIVNYKMENPESFKRLTINTREEKGTLVREVTIK